MHLSQISAIFGKKLAIFLKTNAVLSVKIANFYSRKYFLNVNIDPQKSVPAVTYSLDGNTLLRIDGQTRESVCEIMFEQDNDCCSVSTMILDALLQCPIDIRCSVRAQFCNTIIFLVNLTRRIWIS
jgi:hypothetical protein